MKENTGSDWIDFAERRAAELLKHGRLAEAVVSFMNDLRGRPGVPPFNDAEAAWSLALQGDPNKKRIEEFLDLTAGRLKRDLAKKKK